MVHARAHSRSNSHICAFPTWLGRRLGRSTTQSLRSGDVPTLPLILADVAVREFARLMQSWIYLESLAIFKGSGWPIRDRLLASVQDIGLSQREAFYMQFYNEDDNVVVPGVKPRDPRPWYRSGSECKWLPAFRRTCPMSFDSAASRVVMARCP